MKMKKTLMILLVLFPIVSFSQFNKNNFTFQVEGSYNKSHESFGVVTNNFTSHPKGGFASLVAEYNITNNLFIGLGLDYTFNKNKVVTMNTENTTTYAYEQLKTKARMWMPKLQLGYRKKSTKSSIMVPLSSLVTLK